MIIAGFGYRKSVSTHDLEAAFELAMQTAGLEISAVNALAAMRDKVNETALKDLSQHHVLPILAIEPDQLEDAAERALTKSSVVMNVKGVPSVAETAALAAAGSASRLLAPRKIHGAAACAIAIGEDV